MYRDVGRGGHAAVGQRLEDDGGVQPAEPRAAVLGPRVQRTEPELRRAAQHVHREYLGLVPDM